MSHTSLAELIDTALPGAVAALTAGGPRLDAHDRAAAAAALGQVGRGLATLRADGVSRAPGDSRERQLAALATACADLGATAPTAGEAQVTRLAGACADAAATLGRQGRVEQRWAIAVAMSDLIEPLCAAVTGASPDGATQRAATITHLARRIQQSAALYPPSRADNTVLDQPIPATGMTADVRAASGTVGDAMAVLLDHTRRRDVVLSVAEVLALSMPAEALTRAEDRRAAGTHQPAQRVAASDAWAAVQIRLGPFNDGSRRPHPDLPAHIEAARTIYRIVGQRNSPPNLSAAAAAVQHVPALAEHVQQSVAAWPTRHSVLANAHNLPVREDRLTAYLSRTAPGSLVRVDAVDVAPVVGAIGAARDLSSALAAEVGRANTVIARRTWSAHQEFVERPDAPERLAAARHDAYRSLQQHAAAALRNARTR